MVCFCLEKLLIYRTNDHPVTNPDRISDLFTLMIHYIVSYCEPEERNVLSLIKLTGTAYEEKGIRVLERLIAKKKNGNDIIFNTYKDVFKELENSDVDEIFDFLEWWIMQGRPGDEMDKLLGQLVLSRVFSHKKATQKIMVHKGMAGSDKELPEEFVNKCKAFLQMYTPQKIKAYLDTYIIGQEEAKRNIATAIYNHYQRIVYPEMNLIKSNVLLIGPSGCGKTEIIRRIKELINIPLVISDFSGVVATPWKGRNKEEALFRLYQQAGKNMVLAEHGIVFYDEFDKIIPVRNYIFGGDINNELQGQMLGMMEGTALDVPDMENRGANLYMKTDQILFICAGAFEGLEEIVRKDAKESISGFGMASGKNREVKVTNDNLNISHLLTYGMKPELAGRLGVITVLDGLGRKELRRILTEPKDNIISRYQNEFMAEDKITLRFEDDALEAIIDKVLEMDIGARALNAVLQDVLTEAMFYAPTISQIREVVITEETVRNSASPEWICG